MAIPAFNQSGCSSLWPLCVLPEKLPVGQFDPPGILFVLCQQHPFPSPNLQHARTKLQLVFPVRRGPILAPHLNFQKVQFLYPLRLCLREILLVLFPETNFPSCSNVSVTLWAITFAVNLLSETFNANVSTTCLPISAVLAAGKALLAFATSCTKYSFIL